MKTVLQHVASRILKEKRDESVPGSYFIKQKIDKMSRSEFLRFISNAIELRLKDEKK